MSSLRRVVSDSESESDSERGETKKVNRKQLDYQEEQPEYHEEPVKVLDSELESGNDSEEERTKNKNDFKQQKLMKRQQQQEDEEVEDQIESESESDQDPNPQPVPPPQPRSRKAKKEVKAKAAVKVPHATHSISSKRGRDASGANGIKGGASTEEPFSKKSKQAAGRDDKARSQAEKPPLSPGKSPSRKERKTEQAARGAMKGTGAAAAKTEKAVPIMVGLAAAKVENAKTQGAGRKRKASTPPPAAASARHQQAQKVEGEKSPAKPRKPFSWSSAVEESLVSQLHDDFSNGLALPATKVDPYWEKLVKRLPLEEDLTGLQLCEKVRRMRQRYYTLKDRNKDDGSRIFKSPHEERMFQLWTEIWDAGTKISQPAVEVEHSDDESAETAATTAPRESSKRSLRQSNGAVSRDAAIQSNWEVNNGAEMQGKGDNSISDDENEEEDIELTQRETAGLDHAAGKVLPEPVVFTPFISKPRLEFTPLGPKEDKSNAARRVEEEGGIDQHTEEVTERPDGGKGDLVSSADQHLKQFKEEIIGFFQEIRSSFFPGIEEQRNRSSTGGLGNVAPTGGVFVSGVLEGLGAGSGSPAARELQKKWRELKIQEIALLSQKLHLMQEHCRLQQDELKVQIQILDD